MTASGMTDMLEARLATTLGAFSLDVNLELPATGVTAIFGPSGCGKTTLLRCIAGLHRARGALRIGAAVWQDDECRVYRPPHRREVGYVFQEASLFPHLSVRGNLAFGARHAGGGPDANDLERIATLLGITALLDRRPSSLSGGERQRVALGRALLTRPRLLLMDEPLAALDVGARDEILTYLETLGPTLSAPMLYVTHQMSEADRLADTLVLLERGRVVACGPIAELEARDDLPLLQSPDAAVVLDGRVTDVDASYALTSVAIDGGTMVIPGRHGPSGARRRLRVRAADVSFCTSRPEGTSILNCLPARVISVSAHKGNDAQVNVVARLSGTGARLAGRVMRKSQETLGLVPGRDVFVQIKSAALVAADSGH